MNKLYKFGEFVNEKKEVTGKSKDQIKKEIERDAKKIASQIFDKTRNVHFEYEDDMPKTIIFEVTDKDYKLDYNQVLSMEYSENVLKKRAYKVELKFKKKNEEKISDNVSKYIMKFNVKLTKTDNIKTEKEDEYLVWEFEEKPTNFFKYLSRELKIKHAGFVKWEDSCLKIQKSFWNKLDKGYAKKLIEEEEGIKKKNEKI